MIISSVIVGGFTPGIVPLVLGRIHELLPHGNAGQRAAWAQAITVFALFQAAGAYGPFISVPAYRRDPIIIFKESKVCPSPRTWCDVRKLVSVFEMGREIRVYGEAPRSLTSVGQSIRRRPALSLHFGRFYPPHQIVGEARERPFERLTAFACRLTIGREGAPNGTNGNRA
jgi:hypothetical protein